MKKLLLFLGYIFSLHALEPQEAISDIFLHELYNKYTSIDKSNSQATTHLSTFAMDLPGIQVRLDSIGEQCSTWEIKISDTSDTIEDDNSFRKELLKIARKKNVLEDDQEITSRCHRFAQYLCCIHMPKKYSRHTDLPQNLLPKVFTVDDKTTLCPVRNVAGVAVYTFKTTFSKHDIDAYVAKKLGKENSIDHKLSDDELHNLVVKSTMQKPITLIPVSAVVDIHSPNEEIQLLKKSDSVDSQKTLCNSEETSTEHANRELLKAQRVITPTTCEEYDVINYGDYII